MAHIGSLLSGADGKPVTVSSGMFLTQAAQLLNQSVKDLVIVHDETTGAMRGVITKSDIVRQIDHCPGSACTTRVEEVMTKDVTYCRRDDHLGDVLSVMKTEGLHDIPVVDDAMKPLGVVNATEALRALLADHEQEEALLRDYVSGIGYR